MNDYIVPCMLNSIDFIGDIHGHCECLISLLKKLGYVESAGAFRYPGNERMVVFLGDYVDRGPNVRATLNLVKSMREAGSAIALMGNHEFNMLSFWQKNGTANRYIEKIGPGYLREHTFNKVAVHSKTVADFVGRKDEFLEMREFAKTLPFYLETDLFRAQHASFHPLAVAQLKAAGISCFADGNFDELIARANDEDNQYGDSLFWPIDMLLKGPEMELPNHQFFFDGENVKRFRTRLRWWVNPESASLQELSLQPGVTMPDGCDVNPEIRKRSYYGENERPVFFGHYWLTGEPRLIRHNVCCLDFSIARYTGGGHLACYRFDGEQCLDESKFVWVKGP